MIKHLILLVSLVFLQIELTAQGLLQLNQNSFVGLDLNSKKYDKVFDMDGELKHLGTFEHFTTSLRAEYKIQAKWNLVYTGDLYVLSKQTKTEVGNEIDRDNKGIGDQEIGARYRINYTNPWLVSVGFNQGIGSGKRDTGSTALNTGYGGYCQYLYFDILYYNSSKFYFQSILGVRNRNNNFSDAFNLSLEAAYLPIKNFWFIMKLEGVQPIENGDEKLRYGSINSGIYSQDAGWLKLHPQICFETASGIGLNAGINYYIKGQFIPATTSIFCSIYWRKKSE